MADLVHDKIAGEIPTDPATKNDEQRRQEAITQIERRRRFWMRVTIVTVIMIIVTVSWVLQQYHNAGGWPTQGFTQSSWPYVPHVWNDWIMWPAMVWVLWIAGDALWTFGRKPITESEIQREIERQTGSH